MYIPMENFSFNLKKRKHSRKDFSFHKSHTLGAIPLPDELLFTSEILTQTEQSCTAFAAVATRANEILNASYDPQIFWQDELAFAGVATSDGFDLEMPLAVGRKIGFSPVGNPTIRQDRPSYYYFIHPHDGLDLFSAIKESINTLQRPAMAGMTWFREFGSFISTNVSFVPQGGHCIKIAGFTKRENEEVLVLQQSWGLNAGANGLFYITRNMVNNLFSEYGVGIWSDDPNATKKTLGLITATYYNIISLLRTLLTR